MSLFWLRLQFFVSPFESITTGVGNILTICELSPNELVFPFLYFLRAVPFFVITISVSSLHHLCVAVGVSNKPNPIPSVRSVDGTSWQYIREYFVPFSFQVSLHFMENQSL